MRFSFLIVTLLFPVLLSSQSRELSPELTSFIRQRIEAGMNPSIVVGIIDKSGSSVYSFGLTKTGGKRVNEHTLYEIGSISKVFTGTLLADKVIKGEMETDDPIDEYLPSTLDAPEYEGMPITLGHLSDHTSSLPRLPDNMDPADPQNPYADYTVENMFEFLGSYALTRPVGSEYEYSNLGAGLLGNILSIASGKSYEELMISTIAEPLGLKETMIHLTPRLKKSLATGHYRSMPVPNWDMPAFAGTGGIRSSVHDMLIFLGANLQFFDHPLRRAMLLSHMPRHEKGGGFRVGLGWHISEGPNGDVIWHNGATGGYSSFAGFVKVTGEGIVVLTNSDESVDAIGFHFLAGHPLPGVVPHVAVKLKEFIEIEGVQDLPLKFDALKKESLNKYDFSEEGINALGYYYLNRKQLKEAKAIFLINLMEYPESFNVYDSYAESLMECGEKEAAIMNYKKSLEINPGNTNAIEMLGKMGVPYESSNPVIDTTILESYVGTYQLFPGFDIVISRNGDQLIAQASGQGAFPIFPKNESEFYYKVVNAQIVFNKNEEGAVESLTLFQNGREIIGKKL